MEVLKFVLTHFYLIPITLFGLIILVGLICRWFDNIVDKRCEIRVKAALDAQQKKLQEERSQFEAYKADEEKHMKHLHQSVNNAIQIGFTKAPKDATIAFINELSSRFHRSGISKSFPNLFPNDNPLLWPDELQDRLFRSVYNNIRVKNYDIRATIIGSSGTEYNTTLTTCSCPDFEHHSPQPCKHIIYLHLHLGHAICEGAQIQKDIKQFCRTPKAKKKT